MHFSSQNLSKGIAYRLSYSSRKAIKDESSFTLSLRFFETLRKEIYNNLIWYQLSLVNNLCKLKKEIELVPRRKKERKSKHEKHNIIPNSIVNALKMDSHKPEFNSTWNYSSETIRSTVSTLKRNFWANERIWLSNCNSWISYLNQEQGFPQNLQ